MIINVPGSFCAFVYYQTCAAELNHASFLSFSMVNVEKTQGKRTRPLSVPQELASSQLCSVRAPAMPGVEVSALHCTAYSTALFGIPVGLHTLLLVDR